MLLSYSLLVRISERRQASELNLRQAPGDLAAGIGIGGTIMAAIICILWCGDWVVISVAPMTAVIESLKQTVQSAVIEEVLIRLIVFRMLWRAFGVWPACI